MELVLAQIARLSVILYGRTALRAEVGLGSIHLVDDWTVRVFVSMTGKQDQKDKERENGRNVVPTSILQHHLLFGTLKDVLFHRVFAHEPIHAYMGFLTNAMGPRHSLEVILWVPIALQDTRKNARSNSM